MSHFRCCHLCNRSDCIFTIWHVLDTGTGPPMWSKKVNYTLAVWGACMAVQWDLAVEDARSKVR